MECWWIRPATSIRLAAPHLDAEAEVAAFVPRESDKIPLTPVSGALQLLESLPPDSWAVATSGPRAPEPSTGFAARVFLFLES